MGISNFANMYRGFQLTLSKENIPHQKIFLDVGENHLSKYRTEVQKTISSFVLNDGSLDGIQMQENWFPQINVDVFISHSHQDEELAIIFAGWLYNTFGLTAFIDSCVWGYANNLLKIIDNKYCHRKATNSYDYGKRNYSTSHVHMMLSVALSKMIDNTECLFFLNTPNSITPGSVIQQTESPWIYSEIAMSGLIRRKSPTRIRRTTESFSSGGELKVRYTLPTEHLTAVNCDILTEWKRFWKKSEKDSQHPLYTVDFNNHVLDILYNLTNK